MLRYAAYRIRVNCDRGKFFREDKGEENIDRREEEPIKRNSNDEHIDDRQLTICGNWPFRYS